MVKAKELEIKWRQTTAKETKLTIDEVEQLLAKALEIDWRNAAFEWEVSEDMFAHGVTIRTTIEEK